MTQVSIIKVHRRMPAVGEPGATVTLHIDGKPVAACAGDSLLQATSSVGVYIPALCSHPDLPMRPLTVGGREALQSHPDSPLPLVGEAPYAIALERQPLAPPTSEGCGLCLVEVAGLAGLQRACAVPAAPGMRIVTNSPAIQQARQAALAAILEHHPHVCLTCPQRDGCSRVMCCFNNAVEERCCSIMSHCELRKVADYVIIPDTTPEYDHQANRLPVVKDEPFYDRDYNLCIDCRRCLVACNEVRGVGCLEVKNTHGRTWVGPIADTLIESGCKFCNACVEVCPTGALLDRTQTVVQKQAEVAPCTTACPAGIDVPRYVQLAGLGRFAEANAVVREKLPFPGILGRACYAPCESDCRRGHLDDPLSIRSLKRIAADHDDGKWRELQRREPPTGRRVAVVGAGPAGLSVAFYLAKKGHAVTVFEALPAAGGMARYGIPAYRLPRAVIDAEVAEVARLGVEFRFDTRIDDVGALGAEGFDAVFIGIGAQQGARLDIPGAESPAVVDGVGFLRDVAQGTLAELSGRVAVVGGGDVACDAARSALRLGGNAVALVYRRNRAEMPAHAAEVAACLEEGVNARFQSTPLEIKAGCGSPGSIAESKEGRGSQGMAAGSPLEVRWAQTRMSKPDVLGRRHLEQTPGSEIGETVDLVVAAIGQAVERIAGIPYDGEGRIAVDADTRVAATRMFAGGDAVLGPSSLIDAVAQGRKAASAIDRFLGGDGDIDETLQGGAGRDWQTDPHIGRTEGFNRQRVIAAPRLPATARRGWDEVEQCHAHDDARAEGQRCLKCNLMHDIGAARLPPESWRPLDAVAVHAVTPGPGVYFIHDANKQVLAIKGVADLRAALVELLGQLGEDEARFFSIALLQPARKRVAPGLQRATWPAAAGRRRGGVGGFVLRLGGSCAFAICK